MNITRENLRKVKEEIVSKYIDKNKLDKIKEDIYLESNKIMKEITTNKEEELDE